MLLIDRLASSNSCEREMYRHAVRLDRLLHLGLPVCDPADSRHSRMDAARHGSWDLLLRETRREPSGRCARLERRRQSDLLRPLRFLRWLDDTVELQ